MLRISCLLSTILLVTFTSVRAGTPEVSIAPKPSWINTVTAGGQKPATRDIQNGFFYVLTEEQIHVEKAAVYNHIIKEIVSENGVQNNSQISVNFEPSFETLVFHDITIWRNGQPQHRLNKSSFKVLANEEDLSMFLYQGTYNALCILDDIRKGDKIEYAYTVTGNNPVFNNKFSRNIFFQSYQPIAHQYVSLFVPAGRKLNFKNFNDVPKVKQTSINGTMQYAWESINVKPVPDPANQPSWLNLAQYVQVSEFNTWKEVVEWALQVNPIPPSGNKKIAELSEKFKKETKNDVQAYFRKAVSFVQDEVRYMGIETGEYSHRANQPDRVLTQRYGDCKDKSLLLVALLRAGGIESFMVLVDTYKRKTIEELIPSPVVFNHAVVIANVNGQQTWVDATMSNQGGAGANIYFPAYLKGLVLKEGMGGLSNIPVSDAGWIKCKEFFSVPKARPGIIPEVTMHVKTVYTLHEADRIRDRIAEWGLTELEKNYLKYYSGIYAKIERADSIIIEDNKEKNELTVTENYILGDFFKKDSASGKYEAEIYAYYVSDLLPKITEKATTPIALSFPSAVDYTAQVDLSMGWNITETGKAINRDAYDFWLDRHASGDTLTVHYSFNVKADHVAADKREEYASDRKQLVEKLLYYAFNYNPDAVDKKSGVNGGVIFFTIFFTCLFAFIGWRIYHAPLVESVEFNSDVLPAPERSFGGWLILLMIGLACTPFFNIYYLFKFGYFELPVWSMTGYWPTKSLLLFEIMNNVFISCFASLCFFMLLDRRHKLPGYIITYFTLLNVMILLDHLLATLSGSDVNLFDTGIVRSLIISVAWTLYFLRSTRVKEVFVR